MSNFQCQYCERYFSTRNGCSQHITRCIKTVYLSTEESNEDASDIVSSVNEMSLDYEDFSHIDELQTIREEENLLEVFYKYEYESEQEYAGDISFSEISHSSMIPEEYENFKEILPPSLQSYEEELVSSRSYLKEPVSFQGYKEESTSSRNYEEPKVESVKEFPNEAYADLMTLVIENNLNNKAGNAIIKFFNKHLNLSKSSPLPKNIKTGQRFMEKMNISQLSYSKHCILIHNDQEYLIYYHPIKNCIQNLLSTPEISQYFMFR